jgi:hypothetical protein
MAASSVDLIWLRAAVCAINCKPVLFENRVSS